MRSSAQIAEYALLHWVPSGVNAARILSVMNPKVFLLFTGAVVSVALVGLLGTPA
jgi:hypothetical protein